MIASIPVEKHDKIVYISLDSQNDSARLIQLNPIELKKPDDRFLLVDSFLYMLAYHFSSGGRIGWGPRLEMIMRHVLHLLVSKPGATLKDLPQILIDETLRKEFIAMCDFRPTIEFFEQQWDGIPDDGKTAAFNKINSVISTPEIITLFDTASSTVSISDMITKGLFVIMDLDGRVTEEITNLVGSILIHMFSMEGKSRRGLKHLSQHTFNIYINEDH